MKKLWQYKLTVIVILLILVAILMPGDSVPSVGIPGIDKVVHFGMFFTLTGVYYLEYMLSNKSLPKMLYAILLVGVFAISTEIMQLFAVSRSFDLKDFVIDMIGCIVAIGIWIGGSKAHRHLK